MGTDGKTDMKRYWEISWNRAARRGACSPCMLAGLVLWRTCIGRCCSYWAQSGGAAGRLPDYVNRPRQRRRRRFCSRRRKINFLILPRPTRSSAVNRTAQSIIGRLAAWYLSHVLQPRTRTSLFISQ